MIVLRRTLKAGAALLLITFVPLGLAPQTMLDLLGQQPVGDTAWLRVFAVAGIVLALLHILVAHRIQDVWWWSWAFALFDAGTALVTILNAAVGLPEGSAAAPWWLFGGVSVVFLALYLVGLAKAGREKPFV
jgi:hypothetical protein